MNAVRFLVAGLLATAALPAQDLMAGLARIEITPAEFGPMYGYRNRKCGPATGVHDALYAKALVLEAGGSRMAIVTMDLGSIASERIFARAKAELNLPVVLLAPSHTHSAPAFLAASLGSERPSAYLAEVEEKIVRVLREASAAMAPARLSLARGSIRLGYNRLLLREDGRARALFDNLDRVPHGPVDPEFVLLQVAAPDGAPKALIVHYTAHPVALGTTNCLYSGDFPGVLQRRMETAMPGVQAMFVQGAAAETNPLFQGRTGDTEKDFATMTRMGDLLADEVLKTAGRIPAGVGEARVDSAQDRDAHVPGPLGQTAGDPRGFDDGADQRGDRDRDGAGRAVSVDAGAVEARGRCALAAVLRLHAEHRGPVARLYSGHPHRGLRRLRGRQRDHDRARRGGADHGPSPDPVVRAARNVAQRTGAALRRSCSIARSRAGRSPRMPLTPR
jgi:hypothetical protein